MKNLWRAQLWEDCSSSLAIAELSVVVGNPATKPEDRPGLQESEEGWCPFEMMLETSLPKFPMTSQWGIGCLQVGQGLLR